MVIPLLANQDLTPMLSLLWRQSVQQVCGDGRYSSVANGSIWSLLPERKEFSAIVWKSSKD